MSTIIIAHRGNLYGPDKDTGTHIENTMFAIRKALNLGFHVEIDVRFKDDHIWLGHDEPKEYMPAILLEMPNVWFHCKDIASLQRMTELRERGFTNEYFYHEKDSVAVTSSGYLWTYPGKELTSNSIAVLPETVPGWEIDKAYAICTDYPYRYLDL
jgi:glycerophosphoryl diester phosphodiesterase